ncbi:MAG: AIR carboxylase family protein [Oscillospiraceae bacterium]
MPFEIHIFSAHRTPEEAAHLARQRAKRLRCRYSCSGMAAHLAGAIAANTTLPVIGIPIKSGNLGGIDALLSTVQMPSHSRSHGCNRFAWSMPLVMHRNFKRIRQCLAEKLAAKRKADAEKVLEKCGNRKRI